MRLAWMLLGMLVATPAFADEPAPLPATEPSVTPPGATPAQPADMAAYLPPPKRAIVITIDRDREGKNIALLASIAGAGAILAGVGVYYNLDSKDAADAVSPTMATGAAWTAARQADYDRAHDSGVKAGIFYALGGAALITATVMFIVTAPGSETTVIHPHYTPTVAPTQGGAVLGGAWSF
ncbi:hypothetical protein BH11MYX1_BH11MYX1_04290 [soil metagenome]